MNQKRFNRKKEFIFLLQKDKICFGLSINIVLASFCFLFLFAQQHYFCHYNRTYLLIYLEFWPCDLKHLFTYFIGQKKGNQWRQFDNWADVCSCVLHSSCIPVTSPNKQFLTPHFSNTSVLRLFQILFKTFLFWPAAIQIYGFPQ